MALVVRKVIEEVVGANRTQNTGYGLPAAGQTVRTETRASEASRAEASRAEAANAAQADAQADARAGR